MQGQDKSSLEAYVLNQGIQLKQGRGQCPICQGNDTFNASGEEHGGKAYWTCHKGSCPSNDGDKKSHDLADLIMMTEGVPFAVVATRLGIDNRKEVLRRPSSKRDRKENPDGVDWQVAFPFLRSWAGHQVAEGLEAWSTQVRGWPAGLGLESNPDLCPWPEGFDGEASAYQSAWIPKLSESAQSFLWVALRDKEGSIVSAQRAMVTPSDAQVHKLLLSRDSRRIQDPFYCFGSIPEVARSSEIYICEGMSDYAAGCVLWGRDKVLSAVSSSNMDKLGAHLNAELKTAGNWPTIYFVPDDDSAGLNAVEDASDKLPAHTVYFVKTRFDDLSDALKGNGLDCVKAFDTKWKYYPPTLVFPVVHTEKTTSTKSLWGKPMKSIKRNTEALLEYLGVSLRSNLMSHRRCLTWADGIVRTDNESDAEIRNKGREKGFAPGLNVFEDHLMAIARENSFHPARDWVESKPWDGRDRKGLLWASVEVQADFDSDLGWMLFYRWCMQCISALYKEGGSKGEGVFVFLGAQGACKTRWFESLAPEDCLKSCQTLNPANKDSVIENTAYWIVELGELDASISGASSARLKSFLSNPMDDVRRSFGRLSDRVARRTVWCGTVNHEKFLTDTTGNRRFWTVPVHKCNPEHGVDMQQFWSQMHHDWEIDSRTWLNDEESAALTVSNERFMEEDPFMQALMVEFNIATDPKDWTAKADIIKRVREHFSTWSRRQVIDLGVSLRGIAAKEGVKPIMRRGYEHWPLKYKRGF